MELARGKWNPIERLRADSGHLFPEFERVLEGLRRAGKPER